MLRYCILIAALAGLLWWASARTSPDSSRAAAPQTAPKSHAPSVPQADLAELSRREAPQAAARLALGAEASKEGPAAGSPKEPQGDDPSGGPVTLEVLVLDPDRAPVHQATVRLFLGPSQTRKRQGKTDLHGRLDFKIDGDMQAHEALLVATDRQGGRTSNRVTLAAPQGGGPLEVLLEPGAFIDFRVLESPGGQAVAAAKLFLNLDGPHDQSWGIHSTGIDGRSRLGPFPAGALHWSVSPPAGEHQLRGKTTLLPGQEQEIELYMDAEGRALALEGRFLDKDGKPRDMGSHFARPGVPGYDRPHLWVGSSLTDGRPLHPNYLGEFRLYREPCQELVVFLNMGATGNRYEPTELTVPFGTRGLEFRAVETYELVTSAFDVTSAETGEALPKATLVIYLQDPMFEQESLRVRRSDPGHYEIEHRAWPNLRYVVRATGYQHHYADLPPHPHEGPIQIALQPGLRSPVVALHAGSLAPIPGATFHNAAGELIATTDSAGGALLEGPTAKGKLQVTAKGFAPRRWYASWYSDRVYLDPH